MKKNCFSGNASFIWNTTDVEIKLRYSDFDYFDDPKFKGLVIEDGKTLESTCIDMKLLKNVTNDFSGEVENNDFTITQSEN